MREEWQFHRSSQPRERFVVPLPVRSESREMLLPATFHVDIGYPLIDKNYLIFS